jgi:hypothetical protein
MVLYYHLSINVPYMEKSVMNAAGIVINDDGTPLME